MKAKKLLSLALVAVLSVEPSSMSNISKSLKVWDNNVSIMLEIVFSALYTGMITEIFMFWFCLTIVLYVLYGYWGYT